MTEKQNRTQKPTSFRFKPIVHDVLNEIAKADLPGFPCYGAKKVKKPIPKTRVIEACLRIYLVFHLGGYISEHQIISAVEEPYQIFWLFVMFCRAERGEKGYGYTTKSRKTRFVYGPGGTKELKKIFGKVPKRGRKS